MICCTQGAGVPQSEGNLISLDKIVYVESEKEYIAVKHCSQDEDVNKILIIFLKR